MAQDALDRLIDLPLCAHARRDDQRPSCSREVLEQIQIGEYRRRGLHRGRVQVEKKIRGPSIPRAAEELQSKLRRQVVQRAPHGFVELEFRTMLAIGRTHRVGVYVWPL